jgi:hypothetical protein
MNTFVIAGKRYRIKSKARFLTFITVAAVIAAILGATAFGGSVSGKEKQVYRDVVVRSGDTVWSIACEHKPADTPIRRYVSEIESINGIDSGMIHPGQIIKAPVR